METDQIQLEDSFKILRENSMRRDERRRMKHVRRY